MAARKTALSCPIISDRTNSVQIVVGSCVSRGPYNALGCYMVKPHGQLVQVSFTRYRASTSCLSTSWSSTDLQGHQVPRETSSWEGLPA